MISKIFSVFDSKAEAYLPPMFVQSRGVAIRMFSSAVADEKHDFFRYPADYTLFELGQFDDSNAQFILHSTPVSLGLASEFKAANTTP